ncbi:plasmid mobilization protein [Desulfovibrio piger]|uniref:plasmid mobilization protein n=1 Tax=Desulfovibrio piger TaxID=901 RepID=UPI003A8F6BCE
MPKGQKGLWAEKTLNLRVSAKEHRAIKLLATEAGMTIKDFIFKALDAFSPNWRDKGNSK